VLDEPAWQRAEVGRDFRQSWPVDKAPASEPTEVRVLYDDEALYVGVRLFDSHPDSIAAQLARRDATGIYSDWLHVVIDGYHDRRTAFRFSVNPKGVQKDVRHYDDVNEDLNWDAVWQVATKVDSLGWVAEYRIPFSQIRFNKCPAEGCVWGLNVQRDLARRAERSGWSYVPQNAGAYVSRMGDLAGVADVPRPGRLEVLPYLSSTLTRDTVQAGNPFYRRNDAGVSAGADFKYALTPALTLNGTINPDFGQVELDPAVVNLTQFESFFDEKRPFFVEGADLFRFGDTRTYNNFGWGQFFYSRRIGRAPQRAVGSGDVVADGLPDGAKVAERNVLFADPPLTTTILGATKLSGKTAGGWSVAVLDAVTARETSRFQQEVVTDAAGGSAGGARYVSEREAPVEPLTNYLVARTRKDLNGGRSVVGALVTGVNRRLDDVFVPTLRANAYSGGVDFDHTWGNRTWSLSGFAAASRLAGDSAAIVRAQRSSARYFQRPDAGYLGVDSSRRSLDGYSAALGLTKISGDHWIGSLLYQTVSPGFELNDVGFQQSADRHGASTYLEYHETRLGKHLRNWTVYGFSNHAYDYGGDDIFQAVAAGGNAQLLNFWSVNARVRFDPQYYNDRRTRGGVLMLSPRGWSAQGGVTSDPRRPLVVGVNAFSRQDSSRAYDRTLGLSLDARPTSFVRVLFEPSLNRYFVTSQWVAAVRAPEMTATGGRREVFSDVNTTELAFPLRVNWTFTPRLSLEAVAQPLVSANRFSNFKQLRAARTYDFQRFGAGVAGGVGTIAGSAAAGYTVDPDGDPATAADAFTIPALDFTQRSLRGNAVLRWEYRPGSALFFVWQQTRDGFPAYGDFDARRDVGAVFREKERNVFVVKGTWWVAR